MTMPFEWAIGSLPFLWTPLTTPDDGQGLPERLPFALRLHPATGTLMQAALPEVAAALTRAYEAGSVVSGLMEESGIGRRYADDILGFITDVACPGGVRGQRVLEIGCGSGYLLHRMRELGADVLGVEPGGHGLEAARRYDVPIVRDFFPSPQVPGQFDLIVMYAVLEHIEEPIELLRKLRGRLTPGGRLVLSVPDCEPYIRSGDLSILIHEHWSYFTPAALHDTLAAAGFEPENLTSAGFGGSVYAVACDGSVERTVQPEVLAERAAAAVRYRELAEKQVQRLAEWVASGSANGATVGIYVPGRAINALALAGTVEGRCRFFDDDPRLHGTYLPGFPAPIESREQFIADPPDRLLIMSRTFGPAIAEALRPAAGGRTAIELWSDVIEPADGAQRRGRPIQAPY